MVFFFFFNGGGRQQLAVGVGLQRSGGFSEKGRDTDKKREKEERKKHT